MTGIPTKLHNGSDYKFHIHYESGTEKMHDEMIPFARFIELDYSVLLRSSGSSITRSIVTWVHTITCIMSTGKISIT